MTPLPEAMAKRWLAATRERLSESPLTVPGPYGDQVAVAYMGGGFALLTGFADENGGLQPIELELADSCVVRLDKVRVHYAADDAD